MPNKIIELNKNREDGNPYVADKFEVMVGESVLYTGIGVVTYRGKNVASTTVNVGDMLDIYTAWLGGELVKANA